MTGMMPKPSHGQHGCVSGCSIGQEVIPECEVVLEGEQEDLENRFQKCVKNPNHTKFFSCPNFQVEDLPPQHRTRGMMNEIFNRCVTTVRVKVQYVSPHRPDIFEDSEKPYPFAAFKGSDRIVRYGTGKVIQVFYTQGVEGKLCPCPLCINSTLPKKFWWIRVRTATHVIYDRFEAECASFECFFDGVSDVEDKKVRRIYGFDTFNITSSSDKISRSDVCDVLCVTHEEDVASLLYRHVPLDGDFIHKPLTSKAYAPSKVIVSHPHGCFKRITLGTVLHLTTPISQNYPTNAPLPFKEGTIYRVSTRVTHENASSQPPSQEGHCDLISDGEAMDKSKDDKEKKTHAGSMHGSIRDEVITSQQFNMKEKLGALKSQLENKNNTEPLDVRNEYKTCRDREDIRSKTDDYIADFYRIFIREQVMMLFITFSVFRQNIRNPQGDSSKQQIDDAFQDLYNVLLNHTSTSSLRHEGRSTQIGSSPSKIETENAINKKIVDLNKLSGVNDRWEPQDNEMTSNKATNEKHTASVPYNKKAEIKPAVYFEGDLWLEDWHHFVEVCEKKYAISKSEHSLHAHKSTNDQADSTSGEPFLPSLFIEIDKIVDRVRLKTKQNHTHFKEDILPLIFEQSFVSAFNLIEKLTEHEDPHGDRGCDHSGRVKESNPILGKDEIARKTSPQDTLSQDERRDSIDDTEENVPVGSSFILPSGADYAFRVYNETPGWISFPPGTRLTHPDGQPSIEIGEPFFEFKVDFFVPEQSYVTYDIPTCPGSSGATVFCDNALGQNVTPLFPHSGYLEAGGFNRSGIRHSVYSLYSKLILSDSSEIMQCTRKDDAQSGHVPSLLKVSKALLMKMRLVLTKSVGK